MMDDNRKGYILAIILIVILAVGVSIAFAQDDDVIKACVGENGNLRIVDDASQCKTQETYLEWSNSASANAGLPIVGNYIVSAHLPDGRPHIIYCESGDIATGGGYTQNTENMPARLSAFKPYPETGTSTGWFFIAQVPDLTGYVNCLDVYPKYTPLTPTEGGPVTTGTSTPTATPTATIAVPSMTATYTPTFTPTATHTPVP